MLLLLGTALARPGPCPFFGTVANIGPVDKTYSRDSRPQAIKALSFALAAPRAAALRGSSESTLSLLHMTCGRTLSLRSRRTMAESGSTAEKSRRVK